MSTKMRSSSGVGYSGYRVVNRSELLAALAAAGFPPAYDLVVAEHVTYAYPDNDAAPLVDEVVVTGHAAAGGVQALLVTVDGATTRPCGRRYHLTYSLEHGRKPVESNHLLATVPAVDLANPIRLVVDRF